MPVNQWFGCAGGGGGVGIPEVLSNPLGLGYNLCGTADFPFHSLLSG
jgi:hypothetical protein